MSDLFVNRVCMVISDTESGELKYDSRKMRDSEALHQILTVTNPSDNYTVVFRTITN